MASAQVEPEPFMDWLQAELDRRGWSWTRLSHRADVVPSIFAKAKRGENALGPTVLRRVAEALGISQVEIFRRAGLIDEAQVEAEELAELGRLLALIPDSERGRVLHSLESMLKSLGESYVESEGDPADRAADPDARSSDADS